MYGTSVLLESRSITDTSCSSLLLLPLPPCGKIKILVSNFCGCSHSVITHITLRRVKWVNCVSPFNVVQHFCHMIIHLERTHHIGLRDMHMRKEIILWSFGISHKWFIISVVIFFFFYKPSEVILCKRKFILELKRKLYMLVNCWCLYWLPLLRQNVSTNASLHSSILNINPVYGCFMTMWIMWSKIMGFGNGIVRYFFVSFMFIFMFELKIRPNGSA